jgi:pimeloyl-ACP methyl ester carboxylesterase
VSEEKAADVGPSGIGVAYERIGDPQATPVLLIMGAGAQLVAWPDGFCAALTDRGFQVIRFDNRDSGRSSHFPDGPVPDLRARRHRRDGAQRPARSVGRAHVADR